MNNQTKQEQLRNDKYNQYVEEVTPTHNLWANTAKAFILGGTICLIGQIISDILMTRFGINEKDSATWCSIILILCSVILTCSNLYYHLANWGGAGALVPITGFANGICSCACEFQVEGQVFGIGCQIFKIAGPVILYGIFSSWCLGLLYWIGNLKC